METTPRKNIRRLAGRVKRAIKGQNQTTLKDLKGVLGQNLKYRSVESSARQITRLPETKIAVVLHLYYPETWPQFVKHLNNLKQPYDLFISLTGPNINFEPTIKSNYPNAYVFEIPNRGRDVLPFIKLATILSAKNYQYVLKLHSKKSTHRKDGSEWLTDIVSSLLPEDPLVFKKLFNVLDKTNCGIVGPENQYLSLVVNFEANGTWMTRILNRIYNPKISHKYLQVDRTNYGFFAGTMFWARLDAFKPILSTNLPIREFAAERGQIDATLAHALERLFSLVCEIEGKEMYEISAKSVTEIKYKTDNIPDWSDVYIGPKPIK